ncbi:protein-glutamate methylesterase/protein-glutamine glutaminase [Pontibacter sp. JAM-7]|uniref:protein-glutamate methylesterase/protein-glutamine glutaminase n=1 Tax=Pontibacter sp. JAM-7 TaxID=3366581 RepID=UPI003AF6B8AD
MPLRVLIVDDSVFFRNRISDLLAGDSRLLVVGRAQDGREAVDLARQLNPDVITMDVEMPGMNGIEAVRLIMRESPTNILMLSSLTQEGAQVTLQALDAGAIDFLSKDMRAWMDRSESLKRQLCDKIVEIGQHKQRPRSSIFGRQPGSTGKTMVFRGDDAPVSESKKPLARGAPGSLVVIGASTGGPVALQQVLMSLSADFPYPILLVQHMPNTFTPVFAKRLNQLCRIEVREAVDGDLLKPGVALLAPGGKQMIIDPRSRDRVHILPGDERLNYKPSVDVTYGSAARTFGSRVLAIIMTGMGADGCEGARLLKQAGAHIWAQNKDSCTIYGMPQAVVNAGLADKVLDLEEVGPLLAQSRV